MSETPAFLELPDLACEDVGGATLACNDEFFAGMENLLKPQAAVWKDHEYTDRGKWMDGWETRRRREPGHDWCVIRLGMPGVIHGVVVDTAFFRGNYPESCSIEACETDAPLDLRAVESADWVEILPRSPLQGDSKNAFAIAPGRRFTHLRLRIYPDGGVARLRVHGVVSPDWARLRRLGTIDLAALEHGAWVESCSDMFFGSRNNLIKPGPSRSMADGWETRRRRGPGHDWALVRLAGEGVIEELELDTSHFKGNAPGRCVVEGQGAAGWRPLLESPLQPHRRHRFASELRRVGPVTHLRLSVYPDGGVARLRAWGALTPAADAGLERLHVLPVDDAATAFLRCCGSPAWAQAMAAARPFEDAAAMARIGDRIWWSLPPLEWTAAFEAHPKIGEQGGGAWSAKEQSGTAGAAASVMEELARGNAEYQAKFGRIYLVCASGRSAEEMLADLRARLGNPPELELRVAAEEQARITRLRLARMLTELA